MFAESVAGKQQLVFGQVGHHTVGPVQHAGFEKRDRSFAQFKFMSRFDHVERPIFTVEMVDEGLFAHGRADDLLRTDKLHDFGYGTGMVLFHVIDHEVVNFARIDYFSNAREQVIFERLFDRVKKRYFFVYHEKGVISGPLGRGVSVEITNVPIQRPNPVNVLLNLHRSH